MIKATGCNTKLQHARARRSPPYSHSSWCGDFLGGRSTQDAGRDIVPNPEQVQIRVLGPGSASAGRLQPLTALLHLGRRQQVRRLGWGCKPLLSALTLKAGHLPSPGPRWLRSWDRTLPPGHYVSPGQDPRVSQTRNKTRSGVRPHGGHGGAQAWVPTRAGT